MSTIGDTERAAIARQVAALRRLGWPAGRAIALVADGLSGTQTQTELLEIANALGRGEKPRPSGDPLIALLCQGDAAGPDALLEAVAGFESGNVRAGLGLRLPSTRSS
jgi:hypothetical protein